jgi:hypothetical protein
MHIKVHWKTFHPICFLNLPPTQNSREALHTAPWMYCTIHLLEIIRLSDFSSPLFYPSLLGGKCLKYTYSRPPPPPFWRRPMFNYLMTTTPFLLLIGHFLYADNIVFAILPRQKSLQNVHADGQLLGSAKLSFTKICQLHDCNDDICGRLFSRKKHYPYIFLSTGSSRVPLYPTPPRDPNTP